MKRRNAKSTRLQVEPSRAGSSSARWPSPRRRAPPYVDLEAGATVAPDDTGNVPSAADFSLEAGFPSKGPDGPVYQAVLIVLGNQGSLYLAGTPYGSIDYASASALTLSPKSPAPILPSYDDTLVLRTNDGHLFKVGDFVTTASATPTLTFDFEELKPTPQDMLTGLIDQVDSLPVQVQSVSGQLDAAFAALTAGERLHPQRRDEPTQRLHQRRDGAARQEVQRRGCRRPDRVGEGHHRLDPVVSRRRPPRLADPRRSGGLPRRTLVRRGGRPPGGGGR